MRRLFPALLLLTACGPGRAIGVGEETCHDQANCQPDPTTTSGVGDDEGDGDGETSTSTTGPDPETDGDSDEGTASFIPTSDWAGPDMCDIWNPDDCPEGEKCTAYATIGPVWDANKCVPIMGDQQYLSPCETYGENAPYSGLDNCDKGLMCVDVGIDDMSFCFEFCSGTPNDPMCPNGSTCAIYANGVNPLCFPMCDPLSPMSECINPDNLCVSDPGGEGFVCVYDGSDGMGTYGAECSYVNSCNYGLFCASAEHVPGCQGDIGCCSEFCDVDEPNTCPGKDEGQECIPWWENDPPEGYEHVGGCATPE